MATDRNPWQQCARAEAVAYFRQAWALAPPAGREALVASAERDRVGHHWETGARACVLALLVRPALRPGERPKAGAYRLFGCDVTDDLPVTWDAGGVTLLEMLEAVDVRPLPRQQRGWARLRSFMRAVVPAAASGP